MITASLTGPVSGGKFLAAWLPSLALAAVADPAVQLRDVLTVNVHGVAIPIVTCILGAIGVLASRPLARKKESTLGIWSFLLVTLLMFIIVQLWILESRPSWLFAFVIAMGLGFSGYSVIETAGDEAQNFLKRIFTLATDTIGRVSGGSQGPDK